MKTNIIVIGKKFIFQCLSFVLISWVFSSLNLNIRFIHMDQKQKETNDLSIVFDRRLNKCTAHRQYLTSCLSMSFFIVMKLLIKTIRNISFGFRVKMDLRIDVISLPCFCISIIIELFLLHIFEWCSMIRFFVVMKTRKIYKTFAKDASFVYPHVVSDTLSLIFPWWVMHSFLSSHCHSSFQTNRLQNIFDKAIGSRILLFNVCSWRFSCDFADWMIVSLFYCRKRKW